MAHPSLPSRVALLGGAALMLALTGCSIILPDSKHPPTAAESNAVPPPPSGAPTANGGTEIDHGDPIPEALTYRGVLPCADCAGQRVTLTLLPDWTWRMRRVYFGTKDSKDVTAVSTGHWERGIENPRQVHLLSENSQDGLYQFPQGNGSALRVLEQDGQPVASSLNYSLTQQFDADPIADTFTMRGKVLSANGNTTFAICGTGKQYPVSKAAQGQALTDAVSRLRIAPGAPTLMWINGKIVATGQPPHEEIEVAALAQGKLDSPCD